MQRKNILEGLIGVLAIASIILIATESLVSLSAESLMAIYITDLVICIVFAAEFAYRLKTAVSKSAFLKYHGYEILAMVPAFAFYAMGSAPAISVGLRSLRLIRVIRVIIVIARMKRFFGASNTFIQRSKLIYLLATSLSIIFIGAFVVLVFEDRTIGAQITNYSDAVWWSISTVTTVGYGDIVPNSIPGRIIGMGLMLVGIGVMAALISQVSATIVESRFKQSDKANDLRSGIVMQIKERLDRIEQLSEADMSLLLRMLQSLREAK